jgi:hypothetical protein
MIINSPFISGSTTITGNLTVSGSISGVISGSVDNAVSSSYALNATNATNATNAVSAQTASYADNFTVAGTLTSQKIIVQTVTSSVVYSSGSNVFGNTLSNTQSITGSLQVTGSSHYVLGNVGIGITSPSYLLDVNGSGRFSGALRVTGTSSSQIIAYPDYSGGNVGMSFFNTSGTEVIYFNSANGGIGATSATFSGSVSAQGVNVGTGTLTSDRMMQVSGTSFTSGVSQFATVFNPTFGNNISNLYGIYISLASGTSITNRYQLYVDGAGAGTATNDYAIYVANTAKSYFAGNVGIGTTSSARKLEVASDGTNWISGTFSGTGNTNKVVIGNLSTPTIGGHNAALTAWTDFTIGGDNIIFAPFGAESMRVNGLGNVGIGTTSPGAKLHILNSSGGTTPSNYLQIEGSIADNSNYPGISFKGGTLATTYPNISLTNGGLALVLNNGISSTYNNPVQISLNNGIISFLTGDNAAASERMRITSGGNVGIGTTSPGAKLHVKQIASEIPLIIDSSSTSNPSYTQYRVNNSSGWEHGMAGVGDSYSYLFSYGDFGTTNAKMTLTSGGNVGIGTNNPTATLDINGSVRYRGTIYNQFEYIASGNFNNGTYYNIVGVNTIQSGIYILEGYVDTFAAGGGIYYMRFASVPFYLWDVGSNSTTFVDLPPVLGTGHHLGNPFPLFRLQQTLSGAGIYLQFNPNSTWSGIDNTSGKTFQVYLKRIS